MSDTAKAPLANNVASSLCQRKVTCFSAGLSVNAATENATMSSSLSIVKPVWVPPLWRWVLQ